RRRRTLRSSRFTTSSASRSSRSIGWPASVSSVSRGARLLEMTGPAADNSPRALRRAHLLSVIVPVLNEEHTIDGFYATLVRALAPLGIPLEVLFIDDGSTDGTRGKLRDLN